MPEQTFNTDPAVTVKTSARWSLDAHDLLKGGIMAALMAGITAIQQALEHGSIFTADSGKTIGLAAVGGLVAYLLKNLGTDTKIIQVQDK